MTTVGPSFSLRVLSFLEYVPGTLECDPPLSGTQRCDSSLSGSGG